MSNEVKQIAICINGKTSNFYISPEEISIEGQPCNVNISEIKYASLKTDPDGIKYLEIGGINKDKKDVFIWAFFNENDNTPVIGNVEDEEEEECE